MAASKITEATDICIKSARFSLISGSHHNTRDTIGLYDTWWAGNHAWRHRSNFTSACGKYFYAGKVLSLASDFTEHVPKKYRNFIKNREKTDKNCELFDVFLASFLIQSLYFCEKFSLHAVLRKCIASRYLTQPVLFDLLLLTGFSSNVFLKIPQKI